MGSDHADQREAHEQVTDRPSHPRRNRLAVWTPAVLACAIALIAFVYKSSNPESRAARQVWVAVQAGAGMAMIWGLWRLGRRRRRR
jgi:hypothetical protein